jgi:hypothetical protein
LFRTLVARLERVSERALPRDVVEEELVLHRAATAAAVDELFEKIVAWGRFGELLGYAPDTGMLHLHEPAAAGT